MQVVQKVVVNQNSISFVGLLTIVFIVLKLTNVIDWSWWWVVSPLWIPTAIVLGFVVLAAIFGLILVTFQHYGEKRRRKARYGK